MIHCIFFVPPHNVLISVKGDEEYGEGVTSYCLEFSDHDILADEDSNQGLLQKQPNDLLCDLIQ